MKPLLMVLLFKEVLFVVKKEKKLKNPPKLQLSEGAGADGELLRPFAKPRKMSR